MGLGRERAVRRRSRCHHGPHPASAPPPERPGSRIERRAGCRHIVDEKHTGAADVVPAGKRAADVAPTRFARERHLWSRVAVTDQVLIQHRHGKPTRQLVRNEGTLVEATLSLALGAQRYGYERIDIERVGQRLSRDPGQGRGQIALVVEFEPQNRIANWRLVGKTHKHMIDAPSLVTACGALVAVLERSVALTAASARERLEAGHTGGANCLAERPAGDAGGWEGEVREAAPEGSSDLTNRLQRRCTRSVASAS